MIILELIFAFIIALLLGTLFGLLAHRRFRKTGFAWFFLILFLATWAGGIWVIPFGPSLFGISWMPFILTGIVFILVYTISHPKQLPRNRRETIDMLERIEREKKLDQYAYFSLSVFFWVLLILLIVSIISRYLTNID